MENITTLRIKKVYFDMIKDGSKKIEYRDYKEFYHRLFREKPTHVIFHYQKYNYIKCKIKSIRKIKTPKKLKNSLITFGPYVYALSLSDVKKYH